MEPREFGSPAAKRVLIQPVEARDLPGLCREAALLEELAGPNFRLLALEVADWNRDLTPWIAPAVFGREDFGDGAPATLERVLALCGNPEAQYYLGGYSLGGLFALWAASRTARFAGVAAASPSLWYPGFSDYLEAHPVLSPRVYLSLGEKELLSRNPVLAGVGEGLRRLEAQLRAQGRDCLLEWNPGNHFQDPELRSAKAFAWVLRQ